MKTVLIVDDEPEFVLLIKTRLEPFFHVLTASDGGEGVAIALEKKPDLILSDIRMPKKDGYYLVKELRSHAHMRHTPIILLSSISDTASLLEGEELGVTDYLIKPTKLAELPALIEHYIRTGPPHA